MRCNVKINPNSIGILMLIYTGIVFFSTMLVYWLMILFSFILLIAVNREKFISFFLFYVSLFGLVIAILNKFTISGWVGSLYTMALIIIKLYPLWILAGILSSFRTSTMIYSLRRFHVPNSICIGVAIFLRFIPEYKEYLSEIKEGIKARNIKLSLLKPIRSIELYLVPMIYKAFETGEILSCALVTKGFEYDCEKTSYEDLSLTSSDYIIILIGLLFAGITIWEKV
ncbi:ABC transporter permease [Finegoldia magna]|nr:ABC transporter permease [Finegoldia magna]